ncbi:hypothetical protein Vretimale_16404 [Volvox reticuliferus]|uniref:Uncharacterized protein n=1 Tax=Volvox reticuliferus TaxID=1737510 RepID=A0A8J4GU10_9CHLO|nr:hypothetical protein Vretimale_16404 [Volvox reticuliferus]
MHPAAAVMVMVPTTPPSPRWQRHGWGLRLTVGAVAAGEVGRRVSKLCNPEVAEAAEAGGGVVEAAAAGKATARDADVRSGACCSKEDMCTVVRDICARGNTAGGTAGAYCTSKRLMTGGPTLTDAGLHRKINRRC